LNNSIIDKIIAEIESGNFNAAILYCDKLLNEFPDNRSVYEIRSGCYFAIGDYDSAINDITYSIVKLKSSEDNIAELIGLYGKRGKIYLKKSNWEKAADDYRKILLLNPNIPEIQNSLAVCYRKIGKCTDALHHSSQAIILNDKFSDAYNNRANINICLENYEEAITDYSRAIDLNPESANAYFNRGSIYYDIFNDKENALKDFIKAISIKQEFREELSSHFPDLINALDNSSVVTIDPVLTEEPVLSEETNLDFSLEEFGSLFNDKKPELISADQEINKSDEPKSPDFSSLFDKLEEDKSEPFSPKVAEVSKTDDIIIPTFDLKSMFAEINDSEDLPILEEEPSFINKPVITDDVKLLHEDIQSAPEGETTSSGKMGGMNFDSMSSFKNNEAASDKSTERESFLQTQEEKKSFLRSPVFFIILIGLMGIIILLSVLKFFKSQESQIVNVPTEVKVDSAVLKNTDTLKEETKDTIKESETKKEEVKKEEVKKEEVKKEEPPKQNTELTTKNLGFISDKKQFVLFSEPDGYYVQIGSYKEKTKADEKLKLLEKNNIKGKVYEVDLKEKGIFFRVRAGVFATPEEAKAKTVKIE
jgi:tetratricopeptide (TPR) repeat protein